MKKLQWQCKQTSTSGSKSSDGVVAQTGDGNEVKVPPDIKVVSSRFPHEESMATVVDTSLTSEEGPEKQTHLHGNKGGHRKTRQNSAPKRHQLKPTYDD